MAPNGPVFWIIWEGHRFIASWAIQSAVHSWRSASCLTPTLVCYLACSLEGAGSLPRFSWLSLKANSGVARTEWQPWMFV
ncbi:hypothetical protein BJX68DRAFT_123675 [Aspergillus pseudodeflectus]|uniref:Uncharacterized protein n=1 Tax=Aspergillus pseudodeflectus TaxID=176178 RepID=A0ABR4K5H1_9EURO